MHQHIGAPVFPILSVLVAMLGAWTALDLFRRVRANTGRARRIWLTAAAVALGVSIWAMHFVAMLGFDPGSPIRYDPTLTVLSLGLAIGATGLAFLMCSGSRLRLISAGVIMGLGICLMHYVGMAALRSVMPLGYDFRLVALSAGVAIVASTAALWAASVEHNGRWRLMAAPLLGLAIVTMHYTAMAALMTAPAPMSTHALSRGLAPTILALAVAGGTGLLLLMALVAALFDARFERLAIAEGRKREDQLRAVLENLPLGVYVADAETGKIRLSNAEATRVMRHPLGLEPVWENEHFGPITEDDTPLPKDRYALSEAMSAGGRVGPRLQRYRRGDGTIGIFEIQAAALPDDTGRAGSAIVAFQDVTDKLAAEEELRNAQALAESETRFRQMAEAAPVMLWMSDAAGECIYLNHALRTFWGVETLADFSWAKMLVEADVPQVFDALQQALKDKQGLEIEARYRRADGEIRILTTQAQPRFEADGGFAGMIGVNVDVTEARRAETHQRLLINELNHRVKNTLATVQSMAAQTLRASPISEVKEVLSARIVALAAAHDVLTRENWETADLRDIVQGAIRPFDAFHARISVEGPPARLSPRGALAVSMALHELITNAVKYGALSGDQGRVAVSWVRQASDADAVDMIWREIGGPPVVKPSRTGFGSRLLQRSLAADLGGRCVLRFEPDGVQCDLSLITEPSP
jgi:PAS domain S-box-containing protein